MKFVFDTPPNIDSDDASRRAPLNNGFTIAGDIIDSAAIEILSRNLVVASMQLLYLLLFEKENDGRAIMIMMVVTMAAKVRMW